MIIKWFAYELSTGRIWLMLEALPDNSDYLTTGKVFHDGNLVADNVKWGTSGVWENQTGASLDPRKQYMYNSATNTIIDTGEFIA